MSFVFVSPSGPSTVTNPGVVTGSVTIPNGGYATTASSITMSNISDASVNIHSNGIDLEEHADINIGGQSLKGFMKAMSDRLAILQPDPAKLEQFEALKQAYEHYKTLEALCLQNDNNV